MSKEREYEKLLEEVLQFFGVMGVRMGSGQDGIIMQKIADALSGVTHTMIIDTSLPKGGCPLCGAKSMMDCDCDPIAQMEAVEKK